MFDWIGTGPGQVPPWIAATAVAVLVFWMVGAHNRLVALRARIGEAWAQIDEQLRRRRTALPALVEALRAPLADEQRALDAVLLAQGQLQAAADAMRSRPITTHGVAGLAGAEGALGSALTRMLALMDQQPALREDARLSGWLRELHDVDLRLAFARQLFNDAATAYNVALRQFPTRLLGGVFGFRAAGTL